MKAPDKIYIPFYPNDDGLDTHLGDDWFDSKDIDQYVEGWKEYIHKDALMEKISELRAIPHDNAIARDNAFVEIINIINSIK